MTEKAEIPGKRGRPKKPKTVKVNKAVEAADIVANKQTPLEYMLEVMWAEMPQELRDRLDGGEIDQETISSLVGWHKLRFEAAKSAAPYVHPKLQAIFQTKPPEDKKTGEDAMREAAKRIAFAMRSAGISSDDPVYSIPEEDES